MTNTPIFVLVHGFSSLLGLAATFHGARTAVPRTWIPTTGTIVSAKVVLNNCMTVTLRFPYQDEDDAMQFQETELEFDDKPKRRAKDAERVARVMALKQMNVWYGEGAQYYHSLTLPNNAVRFAGGCLVAAAGLLMYAFTASQLYGRFWPAPGH